MSGVLFEINEQPLKSIERQIQVYSTSGRLANSVGCDGFFSRDFLVLRINN